MLPGAPHVFADFVNGQQSRDRIRFVDIRQFPGQQGTPITVSALLTPGDFGRLVNAPRGHHRRGLLWHEVLLGCPLPYAHDPQGNAADAEVLTVIPHLARLRACTRIKLATFAKWSAQDRAVALASYSLNCKP